MTKPKNLFLKAARETPQPGVRYLTSNAVCARYDASESSVRRWASDPRLDFPKPFQVTPNGTNFWDEAELDAYDKRRKEQARERRQAKTPLTAASTSEDAATRTAQAEPHLSDHLKNEDRSGRQTPDRPNRSNLMEVCLGSVTAIRSSYMCGFVSPQARYGRGSRSVREVTTLNDILRQA